MRLITATGNAGVQRIDRLVSIELDHTVAPAGSPLHMRDFPADRSSPGKSIGKIWPKGCWNTGILIARV